MPRAARLAANVLDALKNEVAEFTLIPSTGGVFEVTVNGRLVYSKKATGRHAEEGEIEKKILALRSS